MNIELKTTLKMASLSDKFNLKKQFVFYASYHNDPINILIHLMCIWPIFATTVVFLQVRFIKFNSHLALYLNLNIVCIICILLILFQYTPTLLENPEALENLSFSKNINLNGAFFFILLYIGK